MNGIGAVEFVFLILLLFIVVLGLLARKVGAPYPIMLVIGGLVLGFIPGIPAISLDPDLIFLVVLPPLLYASAWTTSWREFRYNLISILLLAFGLVGFTVVGVALIAPKVFAGFDWRLGLVLGAIVAPTDAIAATSIARRVGLPGRIVDVLEGESLLNDASGLLALEFALSIVVQKHIPTVSSGVFTLLWLIAGGVAIGLAVGFLVDYVERRIDDGPIEITLSILIPYAVYLAANAVHASGVLAVVACGLLLSRRSAYFFSAAVRLRVWSVWQSLTFVLNGLVFILIGLQLPAIRASIRGLDLPTLLLDGAVFSVLLILLRLLWTYPGARIAYLLRTRLLHQKEIPPTARQVFVVGWTGMRGVVSLAAALALPVVLADGTPFPRRNLIIFLTFCVIVVTLVLQGLTLPLLIRRLGLAQESGPDCEEREARRIVIQAAIAYLEDARHSDSQDTSAIYQDLTHHFVQRLEGLRGTEGESGESAGHDRYLVLTLETLRVQREAAIRLRNEGRISDEILRRIEHELDLSESGVVVATE